MLQPQILHEELIIDKPISDQKCELIICVSKDAISDA